MKLSYTISFISFLYLKRIILNSSARFSTQVCSIKISSMKSRFYPLLDKDWRLGIRHPLDIPFPWNNTCKLSIDFTRRRGVRKR